MNKNGCSTECSKGKCCPITGIPLKCIGKVLCYAIVAALVAFGVDYAVWHKIFAASVMAPDVAHLWRPMDAPQWHMIPVANLLFGLCFGIAYAALSPALSWCNGPSACKGMKFGIIISLIPAVAKVYTCYLVQPINDAIMYAMFCSTFFSCLIAGGIIGFLQGRCCKKHGTCDTEKSGSCGTEGKNHCGGGKNHCGSKE